MMIGRLKAGVERGARTWREVGPERLRGMEDNVCAMGGVDMFFSCVFDICN